MVTVPRIKVSAGCSQSATPWISYSSHHGFVGVSSSLELDGAEGIGGAELCVFADGPLLRQAVVLGQTFSLVILTGWDARGQAHMLTYQTTTTAPAWEAEEKKVTAGLKYYTLLYREAETPRETVASRTIRKRLEERDSVSARAATVLCLAVRRG